MKNIKLITIVAVVSYLLILCVGVLAFLLPGKNRTTENPTQVEEN